MNAPKPSDIIVAPRKKVHLQADLSDKALEEMMKNSPDQEERELAAQRLGARHLSS